MPSRISIITSRMTVMQYELRLAASDRSTASFATVVVHVRDANDNPPVFERPAYRTQITEEDDRNLPKKVLQVGILTCLIINIPRYFVKHPYNQFINIKVMTQIVNNNFICTLVEIFIYLN